MIVFTRAMPLYIYALVEIRGARRGSPVDRPIGPRSRKGVRGERTRMHPAGRIGAIVGEIDLAPEPIESALRAHDAIVRQADRAWTAVLPVRFGTTVADERALRRLIQDRRQRFTRALAHVRGRVQMTVRVFGTPPPVREDARAAVGRVKGRGTRYLRMAAAVEARLKRLPEFDPVRGAVADLVHDERVEPHSSPPLVASVFHLIDRARARSYSRAVRSAAVLTPLRLVVSGPFPPYAFAPDDL